MEQKIIDKELNKKVVSGITDEFIVVGEPDINTEGDITLYANFIFKGREGRFAYTLEGRERGVDWVRTRDEMNTFRERNDEDIYSLIIDWIDEHISWKIIVKMDGKRIW